MTAGGKCENVERFASWLWSSALIGIDVDVSPGEKLKIKDFDLLFRVR